jgi:hypothetical protein
MLNRVICSVVCLLASLMSLPCAEAAITISYQTGAYVRINGQNFLIPLDCVKVDYTGTHGATGCAGTKFDITAFTTRPTFPVTYLGITYTESHHRAYWDWVYTGYTGGGYTDWSMNCHAFGFGALDWPHNSDTIIASGSTECWVEDFSNATIADNGGHTVKIVLEDCSLSVGIQIVHTYEKFRESGIYEMSGACSMPVDMAAGNGERGGMTFSYYKKQ